MEHFESYNDVSLRLELSHEALEPVFTSLADIAERTGTGKYEYGSMTEDGEIPVEYIREIDPRVAQYLFHLHDSRLLVKSANLVYRSPGPEYAGEPGTPTISLVHVQVESGVTANSSLRLVELHTIEQRNGLLSASSCIEYLDTENRPALPDAELQIPSSLDELDDEAIDYLMQRLQSEYNLPFTLDHFEAFHALSEILQES